MPQHRRSCSGRRHPQQGQQCGTQDGHRGRTHDDVVAESAPALLAPRFLQLPGFPLAAEGNHRVPRSAARRIRKSSPGVRRPGNSTRHGGRRRRGLGGGTMPRRGKHGHRRQCGSRRRRGICARRKQHVHGRQLERGRRSVRRCRRGRRRGRRWFEDRQSRRRHTGNRGGGWSEHLASRQGDGCGCAARRAKNQPPPLPSLNSHPRSTLRTVKFGPVHLLPLPPG